ncbi:serine palmitoyltransferase component, partial [Tulasnella sp. 408]
MALRSPSPSSPSSLSMFSKKKRSPALATDASAYLAAVADRDRRAQSHQQSAPSISSASTPALSFSSSVTADSDKTRTAAHEAYDFSMDYEEDDESGLTRPAHPPTSEQVFNTRHIEFGHCANPEYRYVSMHKPGKDVEGYEEQEPPYYVLFSTYLSYLILIVIGHMRDFFGKKIVPQKYSHLMPSNGYAALTSDFDSFYTRRLKHRLEDIFSRPVTGVPGRTIVTLDRISKDHNDTFIPTGNRTRALNVSSYNYLGFAQARGGCADAVEQGIRRYGLSACQSRLEGGTTDLHVQAEKLVAQFIGKEDALITSMGYATNSTTIPALAGKGCLVISDELNHASIRVGVRLSGAVVRTFKHNNMKDLENLLKEVISQGQPRTHRPWKKILVIVEGLYSMEGTLTRNLVVQQVKPRLAYINNTTTPSMIARYSPPLAGSPSRLLRLTRPSPLPSRLSLATRPRTFATSLKMPDLNLQHVNPAFLKVEYAVRGELAIKAEKYREMLKTEDGRKELPFDRVVSSNIGNPQQKGLDQKPLTFGRQVAALLEYPALMESGKDLFPEDAIARAKELYEEIGSIGAYSHSQGVPFIRKNVAAFIEKRDGYPANPNHIFLTAGASFGVDLLLNLLISDE